MAKRTGLGGVDSLFGGRGVTVNEVAETRDDRVRTSVYLDAEDVLILDELQSLEFRRERKRPDRSDLIRRALRFYHQHLVGQSAPRS